MLRTGILCKHVTFLAPPSMTQEGSLLASKKIKDPSASVSDSNLYCNLCLLIVELSPSVSKLPCTRSPSPESRTSRAGFRLDAEARGKSRRNRSQRILKSTETRIDSEKLSITSRQISRTCFQKEESQRVACPGGYKWPCSKRNI